MHNKHRLLTTQETYGTPVNAQNTCVTDVILKHVRLVLDPTYSGTETHLHIMVNRSSILPNIGLTLAMSNFDLEISIDHCKKPDQYPVIYTPIGYMHYTQYRQMHVAFKANGLRHLRLQNKTDLNIRLRTRLLSLKYNIAIDDVMPTLLGIKST
jgi:hypothetical protein